MMVYRDEDYMRLLGSIRQKYGYDFSDYAVPSMQRRIAHFMSARNVERIDTLEAILMGDPALFEAFVQELSVTVTEMFRDPLFFRTLRERVIPRLATYPVLKIWVAGCATGEEAYSVAILLKEQGLLDRSILYATDINQRSLQKAKEGIYALEDMKKYTENYLRSGGTESFSTYYLARYNAARMDRLLRESIVFSQHNLSADRSFNEFQLILCRNVLIYFNHALQSRVIDLFYNSLCHLGFIALGDKESLLFSDKRSFFREFDSKHKIYLKAK